MRYNKLTDSHESKSRATVGIRNPIEALQYAPRTGRQKSASNGRITDIEQEKVHQRLGWANHILLWCDELYHRVVKLWPLPPVNALLCSCIPVKGLRDVVGEVAHVAPPSVSVVQKSNKGVNVCPASSTPRDYLIRNDWDGFLVISKSSIGL